MTYYLIRQVVSASRSYRPVIEQVFDDEDRARAHLAWQRSRPPSGPGDSLVSYALAVQIEEAGDE